VGNPSIAFGHQEAQQSGYASQNLDAISPLLRSTNGHKEAFEHLFRGITQCTLWSADGIATATTTHTDAGTKTPTVPTRTYMKQGHVEMYFGGVFSAATTICTIYHVAVSRFED